MKLLSVIVILIMLLDIGFIAGSIGKDRGIFTGTTLAASIIVALLVLPLALRCLEII